MSDTKYTEDLINLWNAQADEFNQWSELGEDEREAWAASHVKNDDQPVLNESPTEVLSRAWKSLAAFKENMSLLIESQNRHSLELLKNGLLAAISEYSGVPASFWAIHLSPRFIEINGPVGCLCSLRIDFREDRFASLSGDYDTYMSAPCTMRTATFFRNFGKKMGTVVRKHVQANIKQARTVVNLAHIMGVSA